MRLMTVAVRPAAMGEFPTSVVCDMIEQTTISTADIVDKESSTLITLTT